MQKKISLGHQNNPHHLKNHLWEKLKQKLPAMAEQWLRAENFSLMALLGTRLLLIISALASSPQNFFH
jgi:hypothetical protein